jgi:hypothetical protein
MTNSQQVGDIADSIVNNVNCNQQIEDLTIVVKKLEIRIDKLEKNGRKIKCNQFFQKPFLWIILFILLGTILFFLIPIIQENYVGGILAFVGILATFIVVSNYMQVQDIKKDFAGEVAKLNDFERLRAEEIAKLRAETDKEVAKLRDEISKEIVELKAEINALKHPFNRTLNIVVKNGTNYDIDCIKVIGNTVIGNTVYDTEIASAPYINGEVVITLPETVAYQYLREFSSPLPQPLPQIDVTISGDVAIGMIIEKIFAFKNGGKIGFLYKKDKGLDIELKYIYVDRNVSITSQANEINLKLRQGWNKIFMNERIAQSCQAVPFYNEYWYFSDEINTSS